MEIIDALGKLFRSNSMYIAIGIVATTIAIYGIYIKRLVKDITKKMNFFFRFIVYVFIFAFVVGFMSAQTINFLDGLSGKLSNLHLVLGVISIFALLSLLAKNEKQI
ncbi:MAG: DUF3392 domain-containing protein [Chitinivibrionia bacterium]|nr:DUF3392 domain-containing protein [Chitinivibrionia bacterium]